ncbi:MAG: DinB family protein, partial [Gemmatimonadota bacterium]|nr:DinB family protein [Gemmatimonadota bacterium]
HDDLLQHWQGHRRLTRRVIAAFPEDQLFTFSVGGMRTFGELAKEMLGMTVPMVSGAITGDWKGYEAAAATTQAQLLEGWDATTDELNALWPKLPAEKMQETITAFGQYKDRLVVLLLYVIDNEVHHRGQGYVYLRALGIEPPAFWERG